VPGGSKTPIIVDPMIAAQAASSVGDNGLHLVTSPIVGTFYRASAPGAEPFVRTGSTVEEGSILCIVEAMKLLNEIPADVAGEIVAIYVENGQPVEYGQKLFGLRPRR
jgi:acetyl-CoA carboxylase biotin carboxyl carrier protein